MLNKLTIFVGLLFCGSAFANANEFVAAGTLFKKVADMEQEKLVMQLEIEREQMGLDLDRLRAERSALNNPPKDNNEFDRERAALHDRMEEMRREFADQMSARDLLVSEPVESIQIMPTAPAPRYFVSEISGAGGQLQAVLVDRDSGETRRVRSGSELPGFMVGQISADGVALTAPDGALEIVGIRKSGE